MKRFSYNRIGHILTLLEIVAKLLLRTVENTLLSLGYVAFTGSYQCNGFGQKRKGQSVYSRSPLLRYSQITLGKLPILPPEGGKDCKESRIIVLKSQSSQFLLMIDKQDSTSLLLKDKPLKILQ